MKFDKRNFLFLIIGMVLLIVACTPGTSTESFANSQWLLVEFDGRDVSQYGITLAFDDQGGASGSGGCNSYGGAYEVDSASNSLAFTAIESTMMACLDIDSTKNTMETESTYFQALSSVTSYALNGEQLELFGEQKLVFISQ